MNRMRFDGKSPCLKFPTNNKPTIGDGTAVVDGIDLTSYSSDLLRRLGVVWKKRDKKVAPGFSLSFFCP